MADVQIAVIDQQNTEVTVAVPGIQGIQGQTGDVAVAQDGTAGTPGIRFENDANTGIYRPGADQLALSTNGTGRLLVDAFGNVTVSTGGLTLGASSGEGGQLIINNTTNTGSVYQLDASTDTNARLFTINNNCNLQIGQISETGGNVQFFTGGSERLRITSAGLVGIGTSSPSVLLQSQQTSAGASVIGASLVNNSVTAGTGVILDLTPSTAGPGVRGAQIEAVNTNGLNEISLALKTSSGGNPPATRLHITPAGNVGIGTTSPATTLDVRGDARIGAFTGTVGLELGVGATENRSVYIDFVADTTHTDYAFRIIRDSGGPNAYTVFEHRGTGSLSFNNQHAAPYTWSINGSERARIDSSGRLLVGTSADSGGALLQVNGDRIRVATAKTPASATATGTTGEICWDTSYLYVCTATNTWKRAALSTW